MRKAAHDDDNLNTMMKQLQGMLRNAIRKA
jgi:hypothetical protein